MSFVCVYDRFLEKIEREGPIKSTKLADDFRCSRSAATGHVKYLRRKLKGTGRTIETTAQGYIVKKVQN